MDKTNKTVFSKLFVMPKQGRAVKFHHPKNKTSCAQFENLFVLGLGRKVLGYGVLGLKYHVLGLKMVVGDQSNHEDMQAYA